MKCLIIGKIVSCLATTPMPVDAAKAAEILRPNQYVYTAPIEMEGPKVIFLGGSASDGPFGSFGSYPVQRPLSCCGVYVHGGIYGARLGTYGSGTVIYSGGSTVPLGSIRRGR